MDTQNHSEHSDFETELRSLSPAKSPDSTLKNRLEKSLGSTQSNWKMPLTVAASVALGLCIILLLRPPGASGEVTVKPVGHQKLVVETSEPVFVEVPGSPPMWQIDLKMLNRAFIETPAGVQPSTFVPETRSVFVPVVYH